jgi:hypothetical protein
VHLEVVTQWQANKLATRFKFLGRGYHGTAEAGIAKLDF